MVFFSVVHLWGENRRRKGAHQKIENGGQHASLFAVMEDADIALPSMMNQNLY
jgi:hypothetical protein